MVHAHMSAYYITCELSLLHECYITVGAVQMAVDTHLAVLATVALYVILCVEV